MSLAAEQYSMTEPVVLRVLQSCQVYRHSQVVPTTVGMPLYPRESPLQVSLQVTPSHGLLRAVMVRKSTSRNMSPFVRVMSTSIVSMPAPFGVKQNGSP